MTGHVVVKAKRWPSEQKSGSGEGSGRVNRNRTWGIAKGWGGMTIKNDAATEESQAKWS